MFILQCPKISKLSSTPSSTIMPYITSSNGTPYHQTYQSKHHPFKIFPVKAFIDYNLTAYKPIPPNPTAQSQLPRNY